MEISDDLFELTGKKVSKGQFAMLQHTPTTEVLTLFNLVPKTPSYYTQPETTGKLNQTTLDTAHTRPKVTHLSTLLFYCSFPSSLVTLLQTNVAHNG